MIAADPSAPCRANSASGARPGSAARLPPSPDTPRRLPLLLLSVFLLLGACDPATIDAELPAAPQVPIQTYPDAIRTQLGEALAQLDRRPRNGERNGRVAMLLHAYDQFASAEVYYRRAELLDSDFRWPYLRALVLADQGRLDDALASLDAALTIDPTYPRAHIKRAEWLLAAGRLEECEARLAVLEAEQPERPEPKFLRGQLALRQGDADAAIAALEAVRSSSGDFPALHHALAQAHRLKGDDEAVRRHSELAERSRGSRAAVPDPVMAKVLALDISTTTRIERARGYAARGDGARALRTLQRALADDPDGLEVHVSIAGLLAGMREFQRADEHLELAAQLDPQHPNVHYSTGIVRLNEGRLLEAERAFRRTLELDPASADASTQLGLVQELRGDPQAAADNYRRALAQDPYHRQASWLLGRQLQREGKAQEAIARLAPLRAQRDPSTAAILVDLGRAYADSGDDQSAADVLREAVDAADAFGDADSRRSAQALLLQVGGSPAEAP